jgi:hypothetical protein
MKRKEVGNESTLVSMFQRIQAANMSDTVDARLPKRRVDPKPFNPSPLHSPCSQSLSIRTLLVTRLKSC